MCTCVCANAHRLSDPLHIILKRIGYSCPLWLGHGLHWVGALLHTMFIFYSKKMPMTPNNDCVCEGGSEQSAWVNSRCVTSGRLLFSIPLQSLPSPKPFELFRSLKTVPSHVHHHIILPRFKRRAHFSFLLPLPLISFHPQQVWERASKVQQVQEFVPTISLPWCHVRQILIKIN